MPMDTRTEALAGKNRPKLPAHRLQAFEKDTIPSRMIQPTAAINLPMPTK